MQSRVKDDMKDDSPVNGERWHANVLITMKVYNFIYIEVSSRLVVKTNRFLIVAATFFGLIFHYH